MKKLLITLAVLIALIVAGLAGLGLSATDLKSNIDVGIGMGAKLGCSAKHLSGFSPERITEDLSSYTPATNIISMEYAGNTVTAGILGFSTSATYRPGLGCTLDIGDSAELDPISFAPPQLSDDAWPAGSMVTTLDDELQATLQQIMDADNEKGLHTRALLVARGGNILAEVYSDGISPQTPLLGWSMGKSVTAILLGNLELNNQLDIEEKNVFPEWQNDERAEITIEHLLQMSSGLDFSEVYAPGSDATHMLFSAANASDVAVASPLAHEPSTHFSYSSGTTNLLARLFVERQGGVAASYRYLQNSFLEPLSLTQTYLEPDASGIFVGSSYVYASARDWARLAQLLLNGGTLNGHRVVSEQWVKRASQPNISTNGPAYGYQFWLNRGGDNLRWSDLPEDAYAMQGNRAQTVMMIPSRDTLLIRLGWTAGRYPLNDNFAAILDVL